MPNKKVTKANAYWVFMNDLQQRMEHRGPFRPFAARWDHLWLQMTDAEKQQWKERARTIKQEVVEYNDRYLPLDRALKKGYNDTDQSQRLVKKRIESIHRFLDQTA